MGYHNTTLRHQYSPFSVDQTQQAHAPRTGMSDTHPNHNRPVLSDYIHDPLIKFGERAPRGIYLGRSPSQPAYTVYIPSANKIVVTPHVAFASSPSFPASATAPRPTQSLGSLVEQIRLHSRPTPWVRGDT
eukprot:scaffold34328_cov146-Isochrysis_galbana.AAC.1